MWLMTNFGFFSVVQKSDDSQLTIRSRTGSDLDRLRAHYLPMLSPNIEGGGTDYPWRATAEHSDFGEALKRIAEDIQYANFKTEVGQTLGKDRAGRYGKIWSILANLKEDLPEHEDTPNDGLPWIVGSASKKAIAYGGVVVDPVGRILLREVKDHFDDYVWTFPKGRPEKGETPRQAAQREVNEETGVAGRIIAPIPGEFAGGTTINRYFLMITDEGAGGVPENDRETASVRWALPDEARAMIHLTTNPKGRPRDLAVLDAALACLPAGIPFERPITRREDWKTRPLAAHRSRLQVDRTFTQAEMARIHRGFLPYVQEEKWFAYYEDGTLHLHRSWTGYCIYRVYFAPQSAGWQAYAADVTRHPDQYGCTVDDEDRRNVLELIETLLIHGPDSPTIDGFAQALEVAAQPKYLGSPQVVSDLVGEFFSVCINRHRRQASYSEMLAVNQRITSAIATGEGGYVQMPGWHCESELGKVVVRYLNLDVGWYADENLTCILSEGLSGVSMKIAEMLAAFESDPVAQWEPLGLEQLNDLHAFVVAVLLGTNSLQFEGKTLSDFRWMAVSGEVGTQ